MRLFLLSIMVFGLLISESKASDLKIVIDKRVDMKQLTSEIKEKDPVCTGLSLSGTSELTIHNISIPSKQILKIIDDHVPPPYVSSKDRRASAKKKILDALQKSDPTMTMDDLENAR